MTAYVLYEGVAVGVIATLTMDLVGTVPGKALGGVRVLPLGRWILYLLKGTFQHEDIAVTPAAQRERIVGPLVHYSIGIVLATFYLGLTGWFVAGQVSLLTAVAFGVSTSVLPWFVMFPSMGYGLLGRRHSRDFLLLRQSLVGHLVYGAGIWIGVTLWGWLGA